MKSGIKKMLSLLIILCVFLAYLQPAALHVSAENVPICEISSVGYNSLADALAVIRTNETIKLLTNIDYNSVKPLRLNVIFLSLNEIPLL